jgi:hypothetical protein
MQRIKGTNAKMCKICYFTRKHKNMKTDCLIFNSHREIKNLSAVAFYIKKILPMQK